MSVTDSTARRLQARLARAQVDGRLPSVVAALVRDGTVVWSGRHGEAVGSAARDVRFDDVQYRIGSITKTMTAIVVLRLVGEGLLDLDGPVREVIGDVGYADRTPRQFLAHNSGMQSEPAGSWWERSAGVGWDALTAANDGSAAVFPVGQQFHYSNLGYAILGEVIARLRGRSWWECVHDEVLEPLGLQRTSYLPVEPAAQGYSVHPYAGTLVEEPATDTGAMAPAGQVWATLADLASYASFLTTGHDKVLPLEDLLLASHPQSGDRNDGLGSAHGLGFQLGIAGSGMLVGHTGSMPGFLAACFADRGRGTGVAVLANATTGLAPGPLAASLLATLEEAEPTIVAAWTPPRQLPTAVEEVLGTWHWGNTPFVFTYDGREVVALRDGEERFTFRVVGDDLVGTSGYHAGETLHVVRRDDGSVSHLDVATFVFTRIPYDPEAPIPGGPPAGPA